MITQQMFSLILVDLLTASTVALGLIAATGVLGTFCKCSEQDEDKASSALS